MSETNPPKSPRDTGFPEPFSLDRNTTLPYSDAKALQHKKLDTAFLESASKNRFERMIPGNHRTPRDLEDDMYEGLVTKDPEEIDGANATSEKSSENSGIAKRVLRKLSGGAV